MRPPRELSRLEKVYAQAVPLGAASESALRRRRAGVLAPPEAPGCMTTAIDRPPACDDLGPAKWNRPTTTRGLCPRADHHALGFLRGGCAWETWDHRDDPMRSEPQR